MAARKSDLGGSAAPAVAAHNATHNHAPAATPGDLGLEVAALQLLREHGCNGFDMMTPLMKVAIRNRLLTPATGVQESGQPMRRRTQITSWTALLDYAYQRFAHRPRECFVVIFLDRKNQFLADEVMNEGTVDHAPVYPAEVVRRALELGASAIILAHNHPSGDPTPSRADSDITQQVVSACKALRITVQDHIVIGRDGIASLRALGLMG